ALYRGQAALAAQFLSEDVIADSPLNFVQLALLGSVAAADADRRMRSWLAGPSPMRVLLTLAWWNERRDWAAMDSARARFDGFARSANGRDHAYAAIGPLYIHAHKARARGDSVSSLGFLLKVPHSLWPCSS